MNLELDILNIKDVRFGEKTTVSSDRVLSINRKELQELVAEDKRFSQVDIELVHPGDNCRIVQVFDLTEPRIKLDTGENFPGIIGRLRTVGEGRTCVLRGTAVVTIDYTGGARGMLFDMSGPGAEIGVYSKLHNVVLLCHPVDGIERVDYQLGLRIAGLKAALYLAEAGKGLQADEVEVYNLGSLAEVGKGMENLPRVAYVYQIQPLQLAAGPSEPVFYGDNTAGMLPTIVHPNEVLDGAIMRGFWGRGQETYSVQNHAMIKELYKRHGKELCFVGVVVVVATATETHRDRSAMMAAKLVKSVLGADGAVLTKIGGGAPHIDLGQTAEACEELGVKTTVVVQEESYDMTSEGAMLFSGRLADAIVNVGSYDRPVTLPAVGRVLGGPVLFRGNRPAEGEIEIPIFLLCGAMNQIGATNLIVREV